MARGGKWCAADETTVHGHRFRANMPTEEVFTSPDPRRTSGTFRCTRPLTLDGRRIDGIHGRFAAGRLVEIGADNDDDRAYLASYTSRDRGAGRLGEVALVDATSRIGATGRTYGITLLDENAASHIAFGSGYSSTRHPDGARVNDSQIHVDVMIGAPEMEVTGYTTAGQPVPIVRDGLLQLSLTDYCVTSIEPIHWSVGITSAKNWPCATRVARCSSSPVAVPPLFSRSSVPVASLRISTPSPRCAASRAVVSTHMCVM